MELQIIWFFLWGLLWAVFFMTDGFDFGIGTLYPFLGKTDLDKRKMINALGPLWDGNEVWLITAGGVTFAAFPPVYATMFSTLYTPLMLILFALIIRGVSFEFRHLSDAPGWKRIWDTCIFVGSIAPALLFGVAFANIFQGIPFDSNGQFVGNLLTLLNPYGLLGGLLFVVLFMQHGVLWLCVRVDGDLHDRCVKTAHRLWPATVAMAVVFLAASWIYTDLYENFIAMPAFFLVIALAVAGLLAVRFFLGKEAYLRGWIASAATIVAATFFGIIGLFPNMFPSSIDARLSLTALNASSSPLTLKIMLGVVLALIPVVIAYQFWAYRMFSNKVDVEDLTY